VANAQLAYKLFREQFSGARWAPLAAAGARLQRPLWASTSSKNPAYRDVLYVEQLIGPDTVNTMPPATIDAFRDHGETSRTVDADYAGAERTYAHVAELARQTTGDRNPRYWAEEAKHARMVHRQGDRERAWQMYDALLRLLPAQPTAEEIDTVATVRELYAESLIAEGRPEPAIALLLFVEERRQQNTFSKLGVRSVRAALGDAYDQLGRTDEARNKLDSSLQDWIERYPADSFFVLQIRERWGRFQLDHGDLPGAETQFRTILALAKNRNFTSIALTHGDMARLALVRNDTSAALAESRLAIDAFDHPTGLRDVRVGPYLWLIQAEAQRRSGDFRAAHDWARRALDASRKYDAPESKTIKAAEAALKQTS